jgi:HEAT repeat protein
MVSEMRGKNDGMSSVDQLRQMLSSQDDVQRAEAARQLVNRGKEAIEALPALLALQNDAWYQVRIQVPRAIIHFEVNPEEAAKALGKLVNDEDKCVRLYAEEAQRVLASRTSSA